MGLYKQQTKLCKTALDILGSLDNLILIDGKINPFKNFKDKKVETIIKGDAKCYNIGAASIIAKVLRDKIMEQVSNITTFNTDPFNTWKSAFRECVKLSSKIIHGQLDAETEDRLDIWCNLAQGDFAIYALRGAQAGRLYGKENAGNVPALSKINDFSWLEQQFKLTSVLR